MMTKLSQGTLYAEEAETMLLLIQLFPMRASTKATGKEKLPFLKAEILIKALN